MEHGIERLGGDIEVEGVGEDLAHPVEQRGAHVADRFSETLEAVVVDGASN